MVTDDYDVHNVALESEEANEESSNVHDYTIFDAPMHVPFSSVARSIFIVHNIIEILMKAHYGQRDVRRRFAVQTRQRRDSPLSYLQ